MPRGRHAYRLPDWWWLCLVKCDRFCAGGGGTQKRCHHSRGTGRYDAVVFGGPQVVHWGPNPRPSSEEESLRRFIVPVLDHGAVFVDNCPIGWTARHALFDVGNGLPVTPELPGRMAAI